MITVGYGDFSPKNTIEMSISVMTMMISCGIFGYAVNKIGNIVNEFNSANREL
jgi:hypothetical protein